MNGRERGARTRSLISCKWIICISVLTVIVSMVIGLILGVVAVHFAQTLLNNRLKNTATEKSVLEALGLFPDHLGPEVSSKHVTVSNPKFHGRDVNDKLNHGQSSFSSTTKHQSSWDMLDPSPTTEDTTIVTTGGENSDPQSHTSPSIDEQSFLTASKSNITEDLSSKTEDSSISTTFGEKLDPETVTKPANDMNFLAETSSSATLISSDEKNESTDEPSFWASEYAVVDDVESDYLVTEEDTSSAIDLLSTTLMDLDTGTEKPSVLISEYSGTHLTVGPDASLEQDIGNSDAQPDSAADLQSTNQILEDSDGMNSKPGDLVDENPEITFTIEQSFITKQDIDSTDTRGFIQTENSSTSINESQLSSTKYYQNIAVTVKPDCNPICDETFPLAADPDTSIGESELGSTTDSHITRVTEKPDDDRSGSDSISITESIDNIMSELESIPAENHQSPLDTQSNSISTTENHSTSTDGSILNPIKNDQSTLETEKTISTDENGTSVDEHNELGIPSTDDPSLNTEDIRSSVSSVSITAAESSNDEHVPLVSSPSLATFSMRPHWLTGETTTKSSIPLSKVTNRSTQIVGNSSHFPEKTYLTSDSYDLNGTDSRVTLETGASSGPHQVAITNPVEKLETPQPKMLTKASPTISIYYNNTEKVYSTGEPSPTMTNLSPAPMIFSNSTREELRPCPSSDKLIPISQFCDNIVQCPGATDEIECTCRSKIDPAKICDGIFDCPTHEDEIGCQGCARTQFRCDDTRRACIPMHQRCDGIIQCPNERDEASCSILSPSLESLTTITPIYSSGYVLHNIDSKWFPLCSSSSVSFTDFTRSICAEVVGEKDETPRLSAVNVEAGMGNGNFVTYNGSIWTIVEKCPESQLLFVKCPPPACGKKKISRRSFARIWPYDEYLIEPGSSSVSSFLNVSTNEQADRPTLKSKRRTRHNQAPHEIYKQIENRIVGGRSSGQGDWPWAVAVNRDGSHICGATLLSSRFIVSAAHCFNKFSSYHYEVHSGMIRRLSFSPYEQTRMVVAVWQHPKFDPVVLRNDLALVLVDEPFYLNQWTAPICLPPASFDPPKGTMCTVVGWGHTQEKGEDSDSLQEVSVPITSCKRPLTNPESVICAGYREGRQDACQGDSGGPLVCPNPEEEDHWLLSGIVSYGSGCARPDQPGVYTRITHHLSWLKQMLETVTELPELRPNNICDGINCKRNSGVCVPRKFVCDLIVDCLHAEDEIGCNSTTVTPIPTTVQTLPSVSLSMDIGETAEIKGCTEDQFTCASDHKCIKLNKRCDRIVDCLDRSDELLCSCREYLQSQNESYICDGYSDCADLSDEKACEICPEGQFYSKLSSKCLADVTVCDDEPQAPYGEDEYHCLTLISNQSALGKWTKKPPRSSNGIVAINKMGDWHPYCTSSWSTAYSDAVCHYLGYGSSISYKQAVYPTDNRNMKSLEILPRAGNVKFPLSISADVRGSEPSDELSTPCWSLNVTCSSQNCGVRPRFPHATHLPVTEAQWPWHASLFQEGDYLCTATLIHPQWLLTSTHCMNSVDLSTHYIAALLGVWRWTSILQPSEQTRRVTNVISVPKSKAMLLYLESPVSLDEHVNPICIPSIDNINEIVNSPNSFCAVIGPNGDLLTDSVTMNVSLCYNASTLCASWDSDRSKAAASWSGTISCFDGKTWYAAGVHHLNNSNPVVNKNKIYEGTWTISAQLNNIIRFGRFMRKKRTVSTSVLASIPAPHCNHTRCPLGRCLDKSEICDGITNCRDGSDESLTCSSSLGDLHLTPQGTGCSTKGEFQCSDGKCILPQQYCDGVVDCPGNEDERNCTAALEPFACRTSYDEVVPRDFVCDGVPDCSNNRDESQCIALSNEFPVPEDGHGSPTMEPSGYLYFRFKGRWYLYCHTDWKDEYSTSLCKSLGYTRATQTQNRKPASLVSLDEMNCYETLYLVCI